MKKLSLVLVLVLLTLGAANAFGCAATWTGPYFWNGLTIYDYTEAKSCYSFNGSGSVSNATLSCGRDGWQYGTGNYSAMRTSFTIPSNAPILDPTKWNINLYVELISPDQSWWDYFELTITVTHPNNTSNFYRPFSWNGTMGDLNGCVQEYVAAFSANIGDTVTVEVRGKNLAGNAILRSTVPDIYNLN